MATANIEDFLPAIFRKAKKGIKPEQSSALSNMLAPAETVEPALPPPNIAVAPEPVIASGTSPEPMGVPSPNVGPAPSMIRRGKYGRPTGVIGDASPNEKATMENEAIQAYDPEANKPKGWWNRILKPALIGGGLGFLAGGPGGAIGGAGFNALQGAINPARGNEQWKSRRLAESNKQVEGINKQKKAHLETQKTTADIENTGANTNLARIRAKDITDKAAKGPERKIIERKDGVYAISPDTLKSEKVADIPEESGPMGSTTYFERPDGVYGVNPQHPDGFKIPGLPGKPETVEDVGFGNSQIDVNIKAAQAEQTKISEAMKNTPQMVDDIDPLLGTVRGKKLNPVYQDYTERYRKLDDDIRKWGGDKKAPKKTRMTPAEEDPDIRAYADEHFGGDYKKAERAARQ